MKTTIPFLAPGQPSNHVVIPASVNGHAPLPLIFDTGAPTTTLLREAAEHLGLLADPAARGLGAAGSAAASTARLDSLAVGDAQVKGLPIGILHGGTDAVRASIGRGVQGMLGINFLRNFVVTLDYPRHELTLETPSPDSATSDSSAHLLLRMKFPARPVIFLSAHVAGQGPFAFVLETGAEVNVVTTALARTLGLPDLGPAALPGLGGTTAGRRTRLGELVIGGVHFGETPAVAADFLEPLSAALGTRIDGLLGYPFLSPFRVRLDFPGPEVRLEHGAGGR